MKYSPMTVVLVTLALGLCAPATRPLFSQQTDESHGEAGAATSDAHPPYLRASQLLGMTVWNADGQEIGTVHELVIDTRNGRLRNAVLTYREFLGLGDQHFPVPWAAFECQPPQDGQKQRLLLSASLETLQNAKGFQPGEWPDFQDRTLARQLHAHYGVQTRRDERERGVRVRVGPGGVDVDVEP